MIYGFDSGEMTLKMWLRDSLKLLGVVGMLGVGKTALCRLILDAVEVKQRYFPRFLITMSESREPRSMEEVVKRMLEHLGVKDNEVNKLPGLLYALHLRPEGKKFLIVLDDIKQEDEYYEKLASCLRDGHGFPKPYGGAAILNGRHEEPIKKIVEERNVHRLQLLSGH
ncbi:probable disease resistance protein At4g19060 [Hibiscus syriacus]|uniref:probable disease resistance protein At4g19060 n=1 Tax=Hibiscus syriacus TaxID=106335 RepID=UPI0019206B55|nr:probable disease resistance protein At4g19060 [Hibiscus syriacus]